MLANEATSTLVGLSRSKQQTVHGLLLRLAEQPNQPANYSTRDMQGREVHYLKVGNWLLGFWADHAVRELRVVEIIELQV